jgi:hypothetical protein
LRVVVQIVLFKIRILVQRENCVKVIEEGVSGNDAAILRTLNMTGTEAQLHSIEHANQHLVEALKILHRDGVSRVRGCVPELLVSIFEIAGIRP